MYINTEFVDFVRVASTNYNIGLNNHLYIYKDNERTQLVVDSKG